MPSVSDFWRRKILGAIYGRETITRSELGEVTGLNVASVSLALREFIDFGIVQLQGKLVSSGGRKSEILRLNPDAAFFPAVDLASTPIRYGYLNLAGEMRHAWEQPPEGREAVPVESIGCGFRKMLDRLTAAERSRTIAIGVSYTGLLNSEGELTAVNLGWERVPLAARLEEMVGLPAFLAPDCQLKALVEHAMGVARGTRNYLYVSLQDGLGVGCYVDGHLLRGKHSMAGEFGHISVDPAATDRCRCGKSGCLEAVAARPAIVRQYARAARTRPGRVTIAEVFDRGRQGDAAALEAIDRAGRALGLGLAHLVNLFAPELIVLGGDLIAAEDLFVPRIREALEGHALRPLLEDLEIKTSELGPDIALKGAASLAFRQSIQTPELLKQISGPVAPTLEPAMGR